MNVKCRKFSLDSSFCLDGVGLVPEKKSGTTFGGRKPRLNQTLDDARLEIHYLSPHHIATLKDHPISEESLERADGPIRNQSFQKHNKSFHKLFHEIPEEEKVTHTFSCALQREGLYHGRLYISESHVCFYSYVLLKVTKVVIPVHSVREVKRQNSALSMLSIQTAEGEKYTFVSLRGREMCYKLLQTVCSHAHDWSANSSPHLSSAENEVDQMSSYSSLEDCPDHDSSSGVHHMSSEVSTRHSLSRQNSFTKDDDKGVSWIQRVTDNVKSFIFLREMENLSTLFYIFFMLLAVLLLVSGYIALRIIALEEQLNSLGGLNDLSADHTQFQET